MIKYIVEVYFSIAVFVNGCFFIPQIFRILKHKHADDCSLLMFGGFCISQLAFILHGYFINDTVLVIGYIWSIVTCGFTTLLIIYFRFFRRKPKLMAD